ncbi:unnamed protein product [Lampetra planeri]
MTAGGETWSEEEMWSGEDRLSARSLVCLLTSSPDQHQHEHQLTMLHDVQEKLRNNLADCLAEKIKSS